VIKFVEPQERKTDDETRTENAPLSDGGALFPAFQQSIKLGYDFRIIRFLSVHLGQNFTEDYAALPRFVCSAYNTCKECIASGDATFSGRVKHWSREIQIHNASENGAPSQKWYHSAGSRVSFASRRCGQILFIAEKVSSQFAG
jgi:hypothetical protein